MSDDYTVTFSPDGKINVEIEAEPTFEVDDLTFQSPNKGLSTKGHLKNGASSYLKNYINEYATKSLQKDTLNGLIDDYNEKLEEVQADPSNRSLQAELEFKELHVKAVVAAINAGPNPLADAVSRNLVNAALKEIDEIGDALGLSPEGKNALTNDILNYLAKGGYPLNPETLGDALNALEIGWDSGCFSVGTKINLFDESKIGIESIRVGDLVSCFDQSECFGRHGVISGKVSRLYENVTNTFITLHFSNDRLPLTVTPGHAFLDETGSFSKIGNLLKLGENYARIISETGEILKVTGEWFYYSQETAHLFEQASTMSTITHGNVVHKEETATGWKTYNFEVETYHTYIAGGVRVHNKSGFLGQLGKDIDDTFFDPLGGFFDVLGDIITAPLHIVGKGLVAVQRGVESFVNTFEESLRGAADAVKDWYKDLTDPDYVSPLRDRNGDKIINDMDNKPNDRTPENQIDHYDNSADVYDRAAETHRANGDDGKADAAEARAEEARQKAENVAAGRDAGDDGTGNDSKPIILDLDGDGIEITKLSESTVFMDATGDGLENRTAWAADGDGVLFYDADGDGAISEAREFIFTEWDPTASSDIEALKNVFDSNGDGVFDANDDAWADFKIMVTNADGSQTAKTMAELNITSIDLNVDATNIELPDGSVITGQTEFTYSDGSTGTVGDVTLVADANGYDVEEVVSTDGSGNRVVEQTAYAADGSVAFKVTSVTSPDGSATTNSYDVDGDGVVDQIQDISVVTNTGVNTVRSVSNYSGNALATAVLIDAVVTTTSADGSTVTIETDSTGGGWFDQVETRVEQVDGSWVNTIQDLSNDGSVIRSSSETVSIDGLTRTETIDHDGDGTTDLTISHVIVVNVDGSRDETTTYLNNDSTVRSSMTEAISVDGKTKTVSYDRNGDGNIDDIVETTITVNTDGTTSSSIVTKNGDGTIRTSRTQDQSDDALSKTITADPDADGDIDATTVDTTIVNVDGSREQTITTTNTDGSVAAMTKETLGADKISGETWVDLNENGTFEATDLVRDVSVDGVTGEVTAIDYARNDDGTLRAQVTTVTSADGLTSTQSIDADGDGDIDTTFTEVKSVNGSGEAVTVSEVHNQDGSLRSKSTSTTSVDGLTTTVEIDADGDGDLDLTYVTVLTNNPDGSITSTTDTYAGDGVTLLSSSEQVQSDDRLTVTTSVDGDGDGNVDFINTSTEALDGSKSISATSYHNDGDVASTQASTVSDDGLSTSTQVDSDGDGVVETIVGSDTVLNTDGSQTTTIITTNGDGSERSRSVTTISDDRLKLTVENDTDGDGVYERKTVSETSLNLDGSKTTTAESFAADGTSIGISEVTVSDDGLLSVRKTDSDGDGTFDLTATSNTTLLNDGGRTTLIEVKDASDVLRSSVTTTISDDGELAVTTSDINGDGLIDLRETRTVQDDGTIETLVEQLDVDGTLQSQVKSVVSDDGLVATTDVDSDGNGVFETTQVSTTILNADGSSTTTTEIISEDDTVIERRVVTVSDNGLETTTSEDWDNDGGDDLTTVSEMILGLDGSVTETTQLTAANGDLLDAITRVTSGDGRTTTTTRDADGNGVDDISMTVTEADDGVVSIDVSYFTKGGIEEAGSKTIISSDGLTVFSEMDRNGDGETDLFVTDKTDLAADGSSSRSIEYRDDRYKKLASEEYAVSDDGLERSSALDVDGDGQVDFATSDVTDWNDDGSVDRTVQTRDAAGTLIAETTSSVSGDGLSETNTISVSDGDIERTTTTDYGVDGGFTQTSVGTGTDTQTTLNADGRILTIQSDLNSDGTNDRSMIRSENDDQSVTTNYADLSADGTAEHNVSTTVAGNGTSANATIDTDGDGSAEITRTREITYDAQGNEINTYQEHHSDGSLSHEEVQTTSADGLLSTTTIDQNGDGVIDGTTTVQTILNDDGSQTVTSQTLYADGSLRESSVKETSADGRHSVTERDYDGNGIIDKRSELDIRSDGETVLTETTFSEAGVPGTVWVTTTSADGLHQSIVRDGNAQTITRSPLNNGSYEWDNGIEAGVASRNITVTHQTDNNGIETWTIHETWQVDSTDAFGQATVVDKSDTTEVTLDAATKARILDEAARIYDSVLDRGIDFTEVEVLIEHVVDGELDKEGLADSLMSGPSDEFSARYGDLSDAEFVSQLYLNSYGRTPTLDEMVESLADLAGDATRESMAVDLAESAEHLFVGNTHRSTNNYDVIMNAAQFERVLDQTEVEETIANLIDAMFDRDPTAHELEYYSERLLEGTDNPADLITDMITLTDEGSASLSELSGGLLVYQAFLNALGRAPTTEELATWTGLLDDGTVSKEDFIVAMATSIEAEEAGNEHLVASASSTPISGTSSSAETLEAGEGSHIYLWSKGDGGDTIKDTSTSQQETDRLVLTDVNSNDVSLYHSASANDLRIKIISTGETIWIYDWYSYATDGRGIEELEFADGTIWTTQDILDNTTVTGTSSDNTINAYDKDETILGEAGNDTINANGGDDTLEGGLGTDTLKGGDGSDTYIWSTGDGDDTIDETTESIDQIDTLILTDVSSTDALTLWHSGGDDLSIKIEATGEIILIKDQFDHGSNGSFGGGRNTASGQGIELIEFSDGVTWTLEDIYEQTSIIGTNAGQTTSGTDLHDRIFGNGGNDTINGYDGDDYIEGGLGVDTLKGGNGSDTYAWSKGDGDDTIDEAATSRTETDVLILTDVDADDVALTRVNNSDDLLITIISTNEVIKVNNRFNTDAKGYGVEEIHFADGSVWAWNDIQSRTKVEGDSSANTLNGRDGRDNLYGLGGNDTLHGNDGDDKLVGGTGDDSLRGGEGSDLYVWSKGDGDDVIDDESSSFEDTDTLRLTDVNQADADLTITGEDLLVTITETGEEIRVDERFRSADANEGVELIAYADGIVTEIMASEAATSRHTGTIGADTIDGWDFIDVFEGGDSRDYLDGNKGDDVFYGGNGSDILRGDEGSDTFYWSMGEGDDHIDERKDDSTNDVDTLVLLDVNPQDVELTRVDGASNILDDLVITVTATGEVIKVWDFFWSDQGDFRGIEKIVFADGTIWSRADMEANTIVEGTSGNDDLDGLDGFDDTLHGFEGDDNLEGNSGDDTLVGGTGADDLNGEAGSDTYVWSKGDGNDTIEDTEQSLDDLDRLVLSDVDANDVSLGHHRNGDDLRVEIISTGEIIYIHNWYSYALDGRGIEELEFADGTVWSLEEILEAAKVNGTASNDTINGLEKSENIYGHEGNDTINAKNGDDTLIGGLGVDTLRGDNGSDTYVWSTGDGNDNIDDTQSSGSEIDELKLEDVNSDDVKLVRKHNNDAMYVEIISTGEIIEVKNQFEDNTKGIEKITFADGEEWELDDIYANAVLEGTSGSNTLTASGTTQANIFGYGGNDDLNGTGADDVLIGGTGADDLDGNGGSDWASYETATSGVIANLDDRTQNTGDAAGDIYRDLENLRGSDYDDTLVGDDEDNKIDGGDGNDILTGNGGLDIINGGAGDDYIADGAGTGILDGGDGVDTVDVSHTSYGATIDLEAGTIFWGTASQETAINFENVVASNGDDEILGTTGDNTIEANGGDDIITGGAGNDILNGGAGADVFVFNTGDGLDTISDFEDGTDSIDLSSLGITFADLTITDDGNDVLVSYSDDGAGTVTGEIRLEDVSSTDLTVDDFVFL